MVAEYWAHVIFLWCARPYIYISAGSLISQRQLSEEKTLHSFEGLKIPGAHGEVKVLEGFVNNIFNGLVLGGGR